VPRVEGAYQRLPNGLTIDQNQLIQELKLTNNWKLACDRVGISYDRFRDWMRRNQTFQRAYEELHAGTVNAVRKQLEASAQKAAEVFDEALDATKDVEIETTCPSCQAEIKITAQVPDYATRLKAGETVLKVGRVLKDVKEIEGRVTVASLPLHLQLALAAWREGQPIPPGYQRELNELGFIKGELPAPIDTEWEELPDGTDEGTEGAED
jgi:hypothetical protein